MYACDESVRGDVAYNAKAEKKQYCNGHRWVNLFPEDSAIVSTDSISVDTTPVMYECENGEIVKYKDLCSEKPSNYLPLDDTEYPYAGIPRIVLETENHQAIKDKETEIPAKLQIWGEYAPQSEVMKLTIRGRGNSSWAYPKKPYAIKFQEKKSLFGMPKAKKWILLANYRDRTFIRNAVAFELARTTNLLWTPKGIFAEIFLNQKFIGTYYLCEKIEVGKNRLNIDKNAFLLEFDVNYDSDFKFHTQQYQLPVNIKNPDIISDSSFTIIKEFVNSTEKCLQSQTCNIKDFIDFKTFADYYLIYEITQNWELYHPKSLFAYKSPDGVLKLGPVWDFDWGTFDMGKKGLYIKNLFWFDKLMQNPEFISSVKTLWRRKNKESIYDFIDSLANYLEQSSQQNYKVWPGYTGESLMEDENKGFKESINLMKNFLRLRFREMDSLLNEM